MVIPRIDCMSSMFLQVHTFKQVSKKPKKQSGRVGRDERSSRGLGAVGSLGFSPVSVHEFVFFGTIGD